MAEAFSICSFVLAGAAWADAETLAPVIVTATRTAQSADESLASVTVIDRAYIEKKQILSVQGALAGVLGLGVTNHGGLGKPSSVFMRGTNADHVLVLIDGVRAGSASLGITAFQDLPIDQIERIEIVRGPRSSLYGSEAIGGVIQIFTRKGGAGLKPFVTLGGGTYNTFQVSAGISGGDDKAWYSFSGAELYTGGINACLGRPFELGGGGCFTHDPDHDGYSNSSGSARLGYRFDNGLEIEGNLLQVGGYNRYDGSFNNRSDIMQQVIGGRLSYAPLAFWQTTLRAGTTADMSNDFLDRAFVSRFDTRRITASWQNDFTLDKDHVLTAGFDYYNDEIDSSEAYAVTSRDDKAGFLQYQGTIMGHSLDLAVRQDSNQQFGGKTTGSAAWGYSFGERLRLSASYGTAFKAPTFNELYYPFFGNPNLQPESSQSVEVGFKGKAFGEVSWGVNGYYTKVDDLIAFDAVAFQPENINQAEIYGMETQLAAKVWDVDIRANVTLLDPRNQGDGPNKENLLPRRAQQMFQLDLDRAFGLFSVGLTVNQEGRRFDDLANNIRLRGFTTLGLHARYEVYKDVTLEGRVSNLFNEHYQTAYLYNQMGTNMFLSLNWRPAGGF
ncbi:MAG: TonB-dependent vitamin B12 receptor [Candidatus Methylumidiphilus sp.]